MYCMHTPIHLSSCQHILTIHLFSNNCNKTYQCANTPICHCENTRSSIIVQILLHLYSPCKFMLVYSNTHRSLSIPHVNTSIPHANTPPSIFNASAHTRPNTHLAVPYANTHTLSFAMQTHAHSFPTQPHSFPTQPTHFPCKHLPIHSPFGSPGVFNNPVRLTRLGSIVPNS